MEVEGAEGVVGGVRLRFGFETAEGGERAAPVCPCIWWWRARWWGVELGGASHDREVNRFLAWAEEGLDGVFVAELDVYWVEGLVVAGGGEELDELSLAVHVESVVLGCEGQEEAALHKIGLDDEDGPGDGCGELSTETRHWRENVAVEHRERSFCGHHLGKGGEDGGAVVAAHNRMAIVGWVWNNLVVAGVGGGAAFNYDLTGDERESRRKFE